MSYVPSNGTGKRERATHPADWTETPVHVLEILTRLRIIALLFRTLMVVYIVLPTVPGLVGIRKTSVKRCRLQNRLRIHGFRHLQCTAVTSNITLPHIYRLYSFSLWRLNELAARGKQVIVWWIPGGAWCISRARHNRKIKPRLLS